jgi:hypothetical protein
MLVKVYTKPLYEMLSRCRVIRDLQNIFKLLTDDSIPSKWTVIKLILFYLLHSKTDLCLLSLEPLFSEKTR